MIKNKQLVFVAKRYTLLPVIFGIVTTLLYYSGYGVGNHLEQLPIIIRSIDHSFLQNDFFTNSGTTSIARTYYAKFVALLAGSENNLPMVFLIFTLLSNIVMSIITYKFANDLFENSPRVGMYASALVMSVSTFDLAGLGSIIYATTLVPGTLAAPIVLAGFWLFMRGNIIAGIMMCGIASIIHPLIGLEIGGILFVTFLAFYSFNKRQVTKERLQTGIVSLLLLIIFSFFSVIPQILQSTIDSNLFIYIVAYIRHPHHYIPSSFSLSSYINTIVFGVAVIAIYIQLKEHQNYRYSLGIAIVAKVLFFLCLGGYVFVEVFPSRAWVTAQTFRLLFVVNWLGLIFVAGALTKKNLPSSVKMLYLTGLLHPLLLGVTVLSQSLRERLKRIHKWFDEIYDPSLILLVVIAVFGWLSPALSPVILFGFYVLLIHALDELSQRCFFITLLSGFILATVLIFYNGRLPFINHLTLVNRIKSNITLEIKSEMGSDGDEVAEFARKYTPEDSIFLTPPTWGQFRLLARRAIVVDFKAFPFNDIAIAEWYDRLISCYGYPDKTGFAMIGELEENYGNIDDDTLIALRDKYHISYSVLYAKTSTNLNVVFQNRNYKVVSMDGD